MDNNFTIEVVDEENIDSALNSEIKELLCGVFPDWSGIFRSRRQWHNIAPIFSVLGFNEADTLIGHVAVVVRAITTTWNFRYHVASIQGVCVAEEHRKSGLAKRMLKTALKEAVKREFSFAILYCKEPLVPFYMSQGWKLAEDNVVMRNEQDLPVSMRSNCPMYCELGDETFPEGPMDVHNFPKPGGPP